MKCSSCYSKLLVDEDKIAKKCHQCQSWQNYRKHLDLSNVLLATLISFISISLIFAKPLYSLVATKESNIKISLLSSNFDKLKILINNSGETPAGISEVYLDVSNGEFFFSIGKEQWGEQIAKDKSEILSLQRSVAFMLPVIANKQHIAYKKIPRRNCELVVMYIDVGEVESKKLSQQHECYMASFSPKELEFIKYQ